MADAGIRDLSRAMPVTLMRATGRPAAELSAFLNFLESRRTANLTRKEAMEVASAFIVPRDQAPSWSSRGADEAIELVDLEALTEALTQADLGTGGNSKSRDGLRTALSDGRSGRQDGQRLLDRVMEVVADYAAWSGGNAWTCFKTFDKDGRSYLDEKALLAGLREMGATELTPADAGQVLKALDTDGDGRVSLMEFTRLLAGLQAGARLGDTTHWAFYLFEDVRRKLEQSGMCLAEAFLGSKNVRGGDQNKKIEDVKSVPWKDFLTGLDRLGVRMRPDEEDALRDLLNAGGRDGAVELGHFRALVGLSEDLGDAHRATR